MRKIFEIALMTVHKIVMCDNTIKMPLKTMRFNFSALMDLLIVIAVLVGMKQFMLPHTALYAGPISTLSAMIVATILLRRRELEWKDLGLKWPESWKRIFGLTLLTIVAFFLTAIIFKLAANVLFDDVGTSGRFDHVEGNLSTYIIIMILVWVHSAFFEELLFRAFIITKLGAFFGGGRKADMIAVILAAIFFGYRHYYYQGMHGAFVTGGIGLTFGMLYITYGRRNILPLILSHGLINSFFQTVRFLGTGD